MRYNLGACPFHPDGRCSWTRHGAYERKTPHGCLIARFHCSESHTPFSVFPEFQAARIQGTLQEVDDAVVIAETFATVSQAAQRARSG